MKIDVVSTRLRHADAYIFVEVISKMFFGPISALAAMIWSGIAKRIKIDRIPIREASRSR